jgi:sodium transport system ATP-binding protein
MLEMQPLLERRTEGFSQGERMKTALARALVHDPQNIVLDEPTNGLDVMATRALRENLRRLRDDAGKCVVVSTHIMQEVAKLCDHVVLISRGRTVACGTIGQLDGAAGETDFEETFVRLAYPDAAAPRASRGGAPADDPGGEGA